MTDKNVAIYLDQMTEATQLACSYIEGMDKTDFLDDKKTQQAVILNLLLIGEIATKLLRDHDDLSERHPDIAWKNMKGMRNRIAHGYFEINLDIVWDTVQESLPDLLQKLNHIQQNSAKSSP
jgi:uncharacterized protein with HEPN domain